MERPGSRAEHPVLADRPPVAIKVLYTHLVKDIEIKKRFRREAKLLEELQHKSIVELKEYLEQDGECYIVMEFFKGKPLSEMIGKVIGPIVHDRSIPIMNQILEGIGYAHENNIIHRDVKPSNILIDRSDKIKITDLGIAKNVGDTSLTATGTKIGTMWYMSPEQVQGKEADITSDIYSLGATFYEMVSGHVPFEYENEFEIMNAHVNETPKSPTPTTSVDMLSPYSLTMDSKLISTQIPNHQTSILLKLLIVLKIYKTLPSVMHF